MLEDQPKSIRSLRKSPDYQLPERHKIFLEVQEVNEMIAALELAYEQTQNELVHIVLKRLIAKRDQVVTLEDLFRQDEIEEFWDNPGKFPLAVRVWFMLYRDDDIAL